MKAMVSRCQSLRVLIALLFQLIAVFLIFAVLAVSEVAFGQYYAPLTYPAYSYVAPSYTYAYSHYPAAYTLLKK